MCKQTANLDSSRALKTNDVKYKLQRFSNQNQNTIIRWKFECEKERRRFAEKEIKVFFFLSHDRVWAQTYTSEIRE